MILDILTNFGAMKEKFLVLVLRKGLKTNLNDILIVILKKNIDKFSLKVTIDG